MSIQSYSNIIDNLKALGLKYCNTLFYLYFDKIYYGDFFVENNIKF